MRPRHNPLFDVTHKVIDAFVGHACFAIATGFCLPKFFEFGRAFLATLAKRWRDMAGGVTVPVCIMLPLCFVHVDRQIGDGVAMHLRKLL